MQKNNLNTFDLIVEEIESLDPEDTIQLFCYLSGGCADDEKHLLPKYEKKIQELAQKCEGLKDEEVKEFLSGLELSYLINL